jgi:hypothetical protein
MTDATNECSMESEVLKKRRSWFGGKGGRKQSCLESLDSILTPDSESEEGHIVSRRWGILERKKSRSTGEKKAGYGVDGVEGPPADPIVFDIMDRPYNQGCDSSEELYDTCGCHDVVTAGEYLLDGNKKNLVMAQTAVAGMAVTVQGRLQSHYSDFMHHCEFMAGTTSGKKPHFDHVETEGTEAYKTFKSMAASLVKNSQSWKILGDESAVRPEESIECVPQEIWEDIGEEKQEDYSEVTAISVGDFLRHLEV